MSPTLPDPAVESDLCHLADRFREILDQERSFRPDIAWYPYDSLTNVEHICRLLSGTGLDMRKLIASGHVLDLGCADGEFAFFLESLGAQVTAVDRPETNHNGMRGVYALKQALKSGVDIQSIDIENRFTVSSTQYTLACLLGVPYHLRNPFTVLEVISRSCRFCLLSTRVTQYLPDRTTRIAGAPVAYLVDRFELNADPTNFWVFTEACLRRLLSRTGWNVLSLMSLGDTTSSDPVSPDHDERAFVLLESHRIAFKGVTFLDGWHDAEQSGWRWTAQHFSFKLSREQTGSAILNMELFVPDAMIDAFGEVTLSVRVDGAVLRSRTFRGAGDHSYSEQLKAESLTLVVQCSLDHKLPPAGADLRELGLVVASIALHNPA